MNKSNREMKFYNPEEVADIMPFHRKTVINLIKRGELNAIKTGKGNGTRYYISEDDLSAFVKGNKTLE